MDSIREISRRVEECLSWGYASQLRDDVAWVTRGDAGPGRCVHRCWGSDLEALLYEYLDPGNPINLRVVDFDACFECAP
jgi:hypothetical protein